MIAAKLIKEFRAEKNMTQKEFALLSGVDPGVICTIEKGIEKRFSIKMATKIADAMGITIDYLLGRTKIKEEITDPGLQRLIWAYKKASQQDRKILDSFALFLSKQEVPGEVQCVTNIVNEIKTS